MNSIINFFKMNKKDKKCINILELDYDCPNCGIVDNINNSKEDGNKTIKCCKCVMYIRLDGKTIEKPSFKIRREEIDKEYNKLKKETDLFYNDNVIDSNDTDTDYVSFEAYSKSQSNHCDKIDRMNKLDLERNRIGSVTVKKHCKCDRHLSRSSSS